MNTLAVGAHPDDIEYSCFGTLCKLKKSGENIFCYEATLGGLNDKTSGKGRRGESERALGLIPVNDVLTRDAVGIGLDDYPALVDNLDNIIDSFGIDTIFSHYPNDSHQDHRMVSEVVMSSVRRKKISVVYYNSLTSLDFFPNLWVDIEGWFELKKKALRLILSQGGKPWMQDEYLEVFNQDMSSSLLGYKYVEKFIVKRCFL